ncbi:uncharacterized protein LOC105663259 isoform X2 [Megachile rotundata]
MLLYKKIRETRTIQYDEDLNNSRILMYSITHWITKRITIFPCHVTTKFVDFGILTTSLPDSIRRFNCNPMLPETIVNQRFPLPSAVYALSNLPTVTGASVKK